MNIKIIVSFIADSKLLYPQQKLAISCASSAPLPSNITFFEPPPNINPKLAAFYGIWEGKVWSSQDVTLIVERVNSNYVEVIFSVGFIGAAGLTPQDTFYYTRSDVVSDSTIGWATANGSKFIFEIQDGFNKVEGYFFEGSTGAKIPVILTRSNIEELSGITIHRYPYVEYNHPIKSKQDFEHDNNFCWGKAENETKLLSTDIRRFKVWEEVNRCLCDDFGWKLTKDAPKADVKL